MTDLSDVIENIARLFESLNVQYAIMGGIAVRAYGIPRATYDVDFTAAVEEKNLPGLFEGVQALGYTVPDPYLAGWRDEIGGMKLLKFRVHLQGRGIDIDVFLAESAFQDEVLNRRCRLKLNGIEVWLVSPEDLILLKLIANRPRDIADIGDVLFMQGQLDLSYLQSWAGQLKISERLANALKDQYPSR